MTSRLDDDATRQRVSLGGIFDQLYGEGAPLRFRGYDGSTAGDPQAPIGVTLETPRGVGHLVSAPGSLGMARAYLTGDLTVTGVHPGDPYDVLRLFNHELRMRRPAPGQALNWVRSLGVRPLLPPPPPAVEVRPARRSVLGLRHSRQRDADAIGYHYDVSNRFYELVLGPSMAYTCACYPSPAASLEEAQEHKFDLVARKLGLRPGMRLLDVGCGWGGMVRHAVREYGVTAVGVTLSAEQAAWAQARIESDGLADRAQVRHLDYRDVTETGFDAVSSIGLIEHIGRANYPDYFRFLFSRLRPGGRLLNHGITQDRNDKPSTTRRGFIGRYVFPDGELSGSGTIVSAMEDAGFEVQHQENLRVHYARTLAAWCANLVANWDEAVAEAGEQRAKVWGLYMAGSRLGFERNEIQLHQVLGTRTDDGISGYPLRPDFGV